MRTVSTKLAVALAALAALAIVGTAGGASGARTTFIIAGASDPTYLDDVSAVVGRIAFGADQPNVNANASTPGSSNSISNRRSTTGAGCRIS